MRKLILAGVALFSLSLFVGNAEAGLFKKRKICSSCNNGKNQTASVGEAPAKSSEKAPAPSPQAVKTEDKKKAPAPNLKN